MSYPRSGITCAFEEGRRYWRTNVLHQTVPKISIWKKKIKNKSNLVSSEISPLGIKPIAKYHNKKEQKKQPNNTRAEKRKKINHTMQRTFLHKKSSVTESEKPDGEAMQSFTQSLHAQSKNSELQRNSLRHWGLNGQKPRLQIKEHWTALVYVLLMKAA